MLAESVNEAFGGEKEYVYGREGMCGARKKAEIGIHAVRGGNIVGEHEVMFAGEDEIITISHSARSKKVFAAGRGEGGKIHVRQARREIRHAGRARGRVSGFESSGSFMPH